MRLITVILSALMPLCAAAQSRDAILTDVTQAHILPRFDHLAEATAALDATARADCAPGSADLRAAYHAAFDAWISASHLRFGPTEVGDRAFALAFWPDSKGFTPKALSAMIAAEDPAIADPDAFAETSIAGRGFLALERMLYDPAFADRGDAAYRCGLIRAIAADIHRTAGAIDRDWHGYARIMTQPGPERPYRSSDEALQELYKALTTGLEFTADTRLGRPMARFDRPRPNRAEARRSLRSLRHVELSLVALRDLAARLAADHPQIAAALDDAFARSIARAQALDDPALAGVAEPQGRLRIEALQQSINDIRSLAAAQLGPTLGISAGFNSLDGD
ncbi:imelysin family protein [Ruegeria arenilitoris]|uniref:imelysin family protein n=1 Tax=Ruegeria arenilitoris TaxID=1173585 RepID=UPI00147CA787|nr:imelysin family protein [Ruegeria arenilitoris]